MLTTQPSTYDMFALIELYGRKVQSVYKVCIYQNKAIDTLLDEYEKLCTQVESFKTIMVGKSVSFLYP